MCSTPSRRSEPRARGAGGGGTARGRWGRRPSGSGPSSRARGPRRPSDGTSASADDLLGGAPAVDVCGVDERSARLDVGVEDGVGVASSASAPNVIVPRRWSRRRFRWSRVWCIACLPPYAAPGFGTRSARRICTRGTGVREGSFPLGDWDHGFACGRDPAIALGALDGRYRAAVAPLVDHLSEAALNRERVRVEVEWLVHLTSPRWCRAPGRSPTTSWPGCARSSRLRRRRGRGARRDRARDRARRQGRRVLPEAPADRDVAGASRLTELVHFCCTSEDINNLSYALMVRGAVKRCGCPGRPRWPRGRRDGDRAARRPDAGPHARSARDADDARQGARRAGPPARPPAAPDRRAEYLGKLNGATGTYGAHLAAVPDADWVEVSRGFVEHLGLTWNPLTTQIESHDWQAELYADLARFNRVLHNLCTDVWTYISLGYFVQVRGQGTVGSSTMPHKVNPIRFENAEANLEVCTRCSTCSPRPWSPAGCSATSPTPRRSATSAPRSGTRCWRSTTRPRAGRPGRRPRRDGRRPRRELGGARRGRPVGDAGARRQGVAGMDEPYERLKELTRGRRVTGDDCASSSAGSACPTTSPRGSPDDPGDLHRPRPRAGQLSRW